MGRILVADDHDSLRRGIVRALSDAHHEVDEAPNGNVAIEKLHEGQYDVVLSDLKMGGSDGMDVLRTAKSLQPNTAVILMTAFGSIHTAVEAMKIGAFDYVQKPFEIEETELFGHEKGAFTGADKQRVGRFEQADGGTLFLDEIGDMSSNTQAKILRVLQEHEFERLGGTRTLRVDVRLIAATNRNLPQMVEAGTFREDLYYRLNVVTIEMPPLRERKDDVASLAGFFIRRFAGELKKKTEGLDPDALKLLMRYNWPGNIRELENAIQRARLRAKPPHRGVEDLRLGDTSTTGASREASSIVKIPPTGIPLEEAERLALIEALKMSNWVQKDAAELLAISPRVMNYKIKTLGIDFPRGRRAQVVQPSESSAAAVV